MATHGPISAAPPHISPWHSPVPYLFGGLAAMLGIIAFALVALTCSYWKLSGYHGDEGERDLEAAEADGEEKAAPPPQMEEKFLVIMAGQEKPTYLATPMSSSGSTSFGSKRSCCCGDNTASFQENKIGSRELAEQAD